MTGKPIRNVSRATGRNCLARSGRKHLRCLAGSLLLLVSTLAQLPANAAGITIENTDRNQGIVIVDARPVSSGTWILYATQPTLGQAHQAERCAVNYYLLKLEPGLAGAKPELLAENTCFHFGMTGRLLANGDVLIISGARVETWRPGAGKIGEWQLDSLKSLGHLKGRAGASEGMQTAIARNGDVVLAAPYPRSRNDTTTPSGVVARVSAEGKTLWQRELSEPGTLLSVIDAWPAEDGGGWLHVAARAMEGSKLPGVDAPPGALIVGQNRLYRIDAKGELVANVVLAADQMQDFSAPPPPMPDPGEDPEAFQAALQASLAQSEELIQGKFLGYGDIVGHPRPDGGLDLLVGRRADEAELIRVGAGGDIYLRTSLSEAMTAEGLREWIDFLAGDGQVILFGTLGTRKDRLPQGYLSWIGLDGGSAVTRLVPLDELGLEEARNAGDEDRQYLENNPSQQGQLLTSLAGRPLAVSLVYRSRRPAIQVDEGTEQLVVYTEVRDERRVKTDKEKQREQRKAARQAQKEEMNREMAASIGVSEEEYAAMSNRERKEAMVRNGDMEAMMAAAMKQAEAAMQQMQAQQGASGAATTPEMAAAMAQAQQALANAGVVAPATAQPGPSGSIETAEEVAAENTLPLDSNLRGILEYEHPDGLATTLIILDRQSDDELFRKDFGDGSVYEYLDFSRYGLPLNQFAVVLVDADNQALLELTPVMTE